MKRTLFNLTLMLATSQLLMACGPALEGEPLPAESEEVGGQTQALYDSCTDSAVSLLQPDGAAVTYVSPNCSYTDSAATSVDGSYDQTLCPNKFVTEVRQVNGQFFQPFVELVPASEVTTQNACEGAAITGYAWGLSGTTWSSLGNISTNGVWHPASCTVVLPPRLVPAPVRHWQWAQWLQQGARGRLRAALGIFKARVKTGVRAGHGPC